MEEYYLVCNSCNGYYKLEEGESPDDFGNCQCGGDLILVNDVNEYFDNEEYVDYDEYRYKRKSRINKTTFFLVAIIILIPLFLFLNNSWLNMIDPHMSIKDDHSILGSDNRGYVLKDVYSNNIKFTSTSKTIAIVTGIHPREGLSKNVTSDLISKYSLSSNTKIVHYDIEVTNNPDNYRAGRNNGEELAADYILPDILKSNDDLVIICHDHKPGYGQGFYIATPQMDENSVKIAEFLNQSVPGLNYYKADNSRESTTSAIRVSKPLASAGYKTLVYEIPEWTTYNEAYGMVKTLVDKSFDFI